MSRKCNIDPNCPGPSFKGCPDSPEHNPALLFTPAMFEMAGFLDALTAARNSAIGVEEATGESVDNILDMLKAVEAAMIRKQIPLN